MGAPGLGHQSAAQRRLIDGAFEHAGRDGHPWRIEMVEGRHSRQRLSLVRITSPARRWRLSGSRAGGFGSRSSSRPYAAVLPRKDRDSRGGACAWAERIARRYGWSVLHAGPEAAVHRLEGRPLPPSMRAHYHIAVAQHWAPKLEMTLVTQTTGVAGEPDPIRERSPGARNEWILARPLVHGPQIAEPGYVLPTIRLAAAQVAVGAAAAAAVRSARGRDGGRVASCDGASSSNGRSVPDARAPGHSGPDGHASSSPGGSACVPRTAARAD